MRINLTKKFVFLANPHCGSHLVRNLLNPHSDIIEEINPITPNQNIHVSAANLKNIFANSHEQEQINKQYWLWDSYYKFTTISNPFRRIVRHYFFSKPDANFVPYYENEHDTNTEFAHGFNDWLKNRYTNGRLLTNYLDFCCDENDVCLLNDVLKIEEPQIIMDKVKEKALIDILIPDLTAANLSERDSRVEHINWEGDPYSLYNQESRNLVEQMYQKDIELFNYTFGA